MTNKTAKPLDLETLESEQEQEREHLAHMERLKACPFNQENDSLSDSYFTVVRTMLNAMGHGSFISDAESPCSEMLHLLQEISELWEIAYDKNEELRLATFRRSKELHSPE